MPYLELKESKPKGWLIVSILILGIIAGGVYYLVKTAEYRATVAGLLEMVEEAQAEAQGHVKKAASYKREADSILRALEVKQGVIDSLNDNIHQANENLQDNIDSVFYLGADSTWRLFTERTNDN